MQDIGSTRRLSIKKKITYASVTTSGLLVAVFFLGELATRSYLLGDVVPALKSFFVAPKVFVRDPDLGFKLNPESKGVNSLGMQHNEVSVTKPSGTYRVLVIGDSVAFDHFGFVRMLSEELREVRGAPVEVINASIPGYTTYQELVFMKRDLMELNPDLVILQYCLNDNYEFLQYLDDSGRWLLTPEAWQAVGIDDEGLLASLTKSSHLLETVRVGIANLPTLTGAAFVWEKRPDFYAAWDDASWPATAAYLAEMKSLLDSEGAQFMVVAVPWEPQLSAEALEKDRAYTLKPQTRLAEICRRIGAPMLDLHPVLSRHREDHLYRDGIHLTERGHRFVANELLAFLRDHELTATRPRP